MKSRVSCLFFVSVIGTVIADDKTQPDYKQMLKDHHEQCEKMRAAGLKELEDKLSKLNTDKKNYETELKIAKRKSSSSITTKEKAKYDKQVEELLPRA